MLADYYAWFEQLLARVAEQGPAYVHWLALGCLLLAFIKSLPFVALLIPGTALLLSIGALMGAGQIPFLPVWLAVVVGAGLGDWVSYWLGARYGVHVLQWRWVQRHMGLYLRACRFFERWGALSVVACRFVGPLRATIPFAAGICGMPAGRFQVANWASAPLWAAALLLPGWAGVRWFQG